MYIARERPKRALAAPPFLFLIYSARENCARKSVEAELFMMGRRSLAREWKKKRSSALGGGPSAGAQTHLGRMMARVKERVYACTFEVLRALSLALSYECTRARRKRLWKRVARGCGPPPRACARLLLTFATSRWRRRWKRRNGNAAGSPRAVKKLRSNVECFIRRFFQAMFNSIIRSRICLASFPY